MECEKCSDCCTNGMLLKLKDAREIALFDKEKIIHGRYIYNYDCGHLVDGLCDIHEIKPEVCKNYCCKNKRDKRKKG